MRRLLPLNVLSAILFCCVAFSGPCWSAENGASKKLTVINYSDKPVYATAVAIPGGTLRTELGLSASDPVKAAAADGRGVTLLSSQENGQEMLRAYVSLKPFERMELKFTKAEQWAGADKICSARFDAASGNGSLSNGVVSLLMKKGMWNFAYAGPRADSIAKPEERIVLTNCRLDLWLDSELRGRLMGIADDKVRQMGLIHGSEAKILSGEAKANPDGSATLALTRGFGGFASDVTWTETYTLLPGQPVVQYQVRFACTGNAKRYLAYVEHGAGMRCDYGKLLKSKMMFKYDNPKEPSRILLGGSENSFTRIGWRAERCWAGVESEERGNGIGFSTLKSVDRPLPGTAVWVIGGNLFVRLLDAEQENFPYEFSKDKPLELGLAFVATCGETSVWNQTRNLFKSVTFGKPVTTGGSCAVYLGETPVVGAEINTLAFGGKTPDLFLASGDTRTAAVEMDFQRGYRLLAKAAKASSANPITIQACPIGETAAKPISVLTLDKAGEQEVNFTEITKWAGKRQAFLLKITQPQGAQLASLTLEPGGLPAPELGSPSDGMQLTDLATFFRWKQVKGALDYEIELSRDEQFTAPVKLKVRSEVDWPYYMPTDQEVPKPGLWFWRVRAMEGNAGGAWSAVRRFTTTNGNAQKPVPFTISPEKPLFTIEACHVPDLSKFTHTIPPDIQPFTAINCEPVYADSKTQTKLDLIAYLKPLAEVKQKAFVRTHGPAPISHWRPLSDVEEAFQAYPNVLGIMGGETLSAHYHGGAMQTYVNRLLKLCGKYGRIFYDADGTYPSENKWEALYAKEGALMKKYGKHLIFAQKNNILHRQFVSQSSVLGLYLADNIIAQGAWEDGGWYWQQVGFRKLGDIRGQRGGDPCDMPRNFWNLNFLMGISRGCSVFSFEGQTGTMPVGAGWKIAEKGLPKNANPMAHWTTQGELTPAFRRFMEPFVRAVIKHQLVPTKAQVMKNVRLGIYNDGVKPGPNADQYYYEWEPLFAGTYGFKSAGVIPGQLMEYFPNTGRYFYFPIFPQGKVELGNGIQTLQLSQLSDAKTVKARFDQAYPAWYEGDALVTLVGDTLAVLNSNENTDAAESYRLPLSDRGAFQSVAGKIATHSYLVGKFEDGNKRLWLQANAEYPERDTEVGLTLKSSPKVTVTPSAAAKVNRWDSVSGRLTLVLSHAESAVEVEITTER